MILKKEVVVEERQRQVKARGRKVDGEGNDEERKK